MSPDRLILGLKASRDVPRQKVFDPDPDDTGKTHVLAAVDVQFDGSRLLIIRLRPTDTDAEDGIRDQIASCERVTYADLRHDGVDRVLSDGAGTAHLHDRFVSVRGQLEADESSEIVSDG